MGKLKSKCIVSYSFRVEEIENNKFNGLYDVIYIFKKKQGIGNRIYGNVEDVKLLSAEIQQKIELFGG